MKFINNFAYYFLKKDKDKKIEIDNKNKDDDIENKKGQTAIYWFNYVNKNKFKLLLILLSVGLLSLLFLLNPNITNQEIYSENFEFDVIYHIKYSTRDNSTPDTIDSLTFLLLSKKYGDSYEILKKLIKKDSNNALYRYHISITAMILNKHLEAQNHLIFLKNNENLLYDVAQWYLALSYLKTDKEKAIKEFELIANNKFHYKNKDAKKILRLLK